ncbi:hypothetical protein [Lysobacter arvi]|uniref:Secreted protein n=1 Tax=Lysobacter arvi TaxID=3038776 RepID=A0ABU1CE09_9GAMM|nr:hypothetical protein [Lysobacter arvi]MDR0183434.1 hypothetical protein [Lysobacter arvi]
MRWSLPFAAVMSLSAFLPWSIAQAAEKTYVPIEERLSDEQMQATGLDTLRPDQLALLNRLLSEDRAEVARAVEAEVVAKQAQDSAGRRPERVERQAVTGTIAGELRRWATGQTVQLDNGQRWRVIQGDVYFSSPVTNPKVTIAPGFLGAWWMRMEDDTPAVKVQRVD